MKKKLPLSVLKVLEKFVKEESRFFRTLQRDDSLLYLVDSDESSDFYFNIEKINTDNGLKLLIDRKPYNHDTTESLKVWFKMEQFEGQFKSWVNLLEGYEQTPSFHDDPILDSFIDEYYTEFEIVDENSDIEPFKTKQILLLDEYLEEVEDNIDEYKTEENESIIEEIKNDVIILRENLTQKPKKWVVKKLAIIWAKLTKQSTDLLKGFVSEAKKQGIKEIVKRGGQFLIDGGITDLI